MGRRLAARVRSPQGYDWFCRTSSRRLTAEELRRIRSLAADIPALWRTAETCTADKKEILRPLIERVVVTVEEASKQVAVQIHWVGGVMTEHALRWPVGSFERLADFSRLRERVTRWLAEGKTMSQIADGLTREGSQSPSWRLDRFTPRRVGELIYRLGLSKPRPPAESLLADEWWLRDFAGEVGVSLPRLRYRVKQGYVHMRKCKAWGLLVIWADAANRSARGTCAITRGRLG